MARQLRQALSEVIQTTPNGLSPSRREAVTTLDAYTHGSRFYNVKQFRNACTRQLARLGHYKEALLSSTEAFHCTIKIGHAPIVKDFSEVIVGRPEFSAGEIDAGIKTLQQSIQSSKDFLDKVDQAQQGLITTPKPPMMGGPPNGQQNPGNAPNRQMVGRPQNGPQVLKGPLMGLNSLGLEFNQVILPARLIAIRTNKKQIVPLGNQYMCKTKTI